MYFFIHIIQFYFIFVRSYLQSKKYTENYMILTVIQTGKWHLKGLTKMYNFCTISYIYIKSLMIDVPMLIWRSVRQSDVTAKTNEAFEQLFRIRI